MFFLIIMQYGVPSEIWVWYKIKSKPVRDVLIVEKIEDAFIDTDE